LFPTAEDAMSVHDGKARDRYVVRWREDGRNRSSRFRTLEEAEAFDATHRRAAPATAGVAASSAGSGGVYPYETKDGTRYRVSFRQSDGSLSTRRGFMSRRATTVARRRLIESIERGEVKVARETFGTFWPWLLEERRPYLTMGSFVDNETHGCLCVPGSWVEPFGDLRRQERRRVRLLRARDRSTFSATRVSGAQEPPWQ
jgi:hypothetical protein